MGSTNRDYMRDDDDNPRTPSWGHDVPTTKWLIIVTVGLFFLESIFTHDLEIGEKPGSLVTVVSVNTEVHQRPIDNAVARRAIGVQVSYVEEWLQLEPDKVLRGQVWRLVTFVFCHQRDQLPIGLVFDMMMLWYFGSTLERMYGSREFLWFYLFAALACGLVFTAFGFKMFLPSPLMGANPSILALLTLFATHFPRQELLFFGLIPVQIRVLLLIYVVMDFYGIVQAYSGQGTWVTVAYMSELWGMAFGYVYRQQNWRFTKLADWFDLRRLRRTMRRVTTARNLKVFQPESTSSLDEQVDAILAKIHEQGSESLTDRERSVLQRASDQAKNRP